MRTYDVTVRQRTNRKGSQLVDISSYTCDSNLNIRAIVIYLFQRHFGRAPKTHWGESGHLCMGQAWDTKRVTKARCEIEVFQHNRPATAWREAHWIIWNAKLPRLTERRAA